MTQQELDRLEEMAETLGSETWKPTLIGEDKIGGKYAGMGVYEGKYGPQRYWVLAEALAVQGGETTEGRFRVWEVADIRNGFKQLDPQIGDDVFIMYVGDKPLDGGKVSKRFKFSAVDHTTGKPKMAVEKAPQTPQDGDGQQEKDLFSDDLTF